eukprot:41568-Amphidinium_carterae.1
MLRGFDVTDTGLDVCLQARDQAVGVLDLLRKQMNLDILSAKQMGIQGKAHWPIESPQGIYEH